MINRSWVEIDLKKIRENYRIYKSQLPKDKKIMAVVKADAYGHGDKEVALCLQEEGCEDFAVSNINEAAGLRDAGVNGQILILGYTPLECAEILYEKDITQALVSEDYAEALLKEQEKLPGKLKVQYALDTGMNRIGLDADIPEECSRVIHAYAEKFKLTGVFTHLCVADTENDECEEFTKGQIDKFEAVAERIGDLKLPFVHCLNSAGGLWYHGAESTFARLGIVLYGLKPDYENRLPEGVLPALSWKSTVAMVKEIREGETIGYGRTYRASEPRKIATIPTGYADGLSRRMSNVSYVLIRGRRAPITGRVCMDQFMADVTEIPDVKMGDEVVIIGEGRTADDIAHEIGTIGYEVLCNISKRVERRYIPQETVEEGKYEVY